MLSIFIKHEKIYQISQGIRNYDVDKAFFDYLDYLPAYNNLFLISYNDLNRNWIDKMILTRIPMHILLHTFYILYSYVRKVLISLT